MYVVVNMSRPMPTLGGDMFYIMGLDGAVTQRDLDEAIETVAYFAFEEGHDLGTAQIFQLVPVAITPALQRRFEEARAAIEQDLGGD